MTRTWELGRPGEEGIPICHICADDADDREARANGVLIAAAPAMLEAIETAIEELDSGAVMSAMAGMWQHRINKALYVLRKAAKDARE